MAKINTGKLKDPYVELPLKDGRKVVVKLEDEGVVIDVWKDDEVVETTWRLYSEMEKGE